MKITYISEYLNKKARLVPLPSNNNNNDSSRSELTSNTFHNFVLTNISNCTKFHNQGLLPGLEKDRTCFWRCYDDPVKALI